jgi:hypothetical protein
VPTKRTFDLIVITGILMHLAIGLARMESRRLAVSGGPVGSTVGHAGVVVLGA